MCVYVEQYVSCEFYYLYIFNRHYTTYNYTVVYYLKIIFITFIIVCVCGICVVREQVAELASLSISVLGIRLRSSCLWAGPLPAEPSSKPYKLLLLLFLRWCHMQASSRLNYCCDSEITVSIKDFLRSNVTLYYT